MAPEQVTADPALDGRCDLHSLGAVACFLLTGRPPFEAKGSGGVMLACAPCVEIRWIDRARRWPFRPRSSGRPKSEETYGVSETLSPAN
jgi:hypothetical protein